MLQNKINILSTRPLSKSLLEKAAAKNIFIESLSFIETEMIVDNVLKEKIINLSYQQLNVVFTSMNAVEAVAKYLENTKPDWKIYCIGSTTKNLVKDYFGENSVAETADSASALADAIIATNNTSSVIFFCGNNRRNELPDKLRQKNIEVSEVEVYKTIETPFFISKNYDAILFYSPSAVKSFFSINKISNETILFAIGNTTVGEIKKYAANRIIIANEPSKELLAEQAIHYLTPNPSPKEGGASKPYPD